MSIYLDASVLVPMFVDDPLADRARAFLRARAPALIVSDFAAAEFASAAARLVRIGDITSDSAKESFAMFDLWILREAERAETTTADITSAASLIRRLDLTLRAPDAIHIAIAIRMGAELFTFDEAMAGAAQALGIDVVVA